MSASKASPTAIGLNESTPETEFTKAACQEDARIERLLACRSWQFRRRRALAKKAEVQWSRDIMDPEFQKNLRIYRRLLAGAVGLYQRAFSPGQPPPDQEVLTRRGDELERRIVLPKDVPLTLKILLGHRFALDHLLAELGDAHYLRLRAAELHAEREGTVVTWREMFPDTKPPFDTDGLQEIKLKVGQLLAAKEAQDQTIRARRELKATALYGLLLLFSFAVAAFAFFLSPTEGNVLLPATAGATGAALGMLLKLRDDVRLGAEIREFVPFSLVQVVIGATAGLVVFTLEDTQVINLSGPSGVAAFSFAAGFSEAAFVRLLGWVLDSGEGMPEKNLRKKEAGT